uniref:PDZ domain-containing protein n=1 Tax=Labrus bergylta TaxID=56723 RepID=A0A3Q3FNV7_9LABR
EFHFPGFNPATSTVLSNPRIMSRSHHNLAQMPESLEHQAPAESYHGQLHVRMSQAPPNQIASRLQQQQIASSDTDSLSQQQDSFGVLSHSSPAWSHGRKKESDSSSIEDTGQAYVVSLKKKLSALPSPEREITTVHLKKDVKYGLFQVVGGENSGRMDLGTIISSITPGGPADVNGCLKPDRLISVNDVNLHGLSHATTVDILQNAADDVNLVVSQPKERLYKHQLIVLNSQDTRTGSVAKVIKPPAINVQHCLERAKAVPATAPIAQHQRPEPDVGLDPTPPALP